MGCLLIFTDGIRREHATTICDPHTQPLTRKGFLKMKQVILLVTLLCACFVTGRADSLGVSLFQDPVRPTSTTTQATDTFVLTNGHTVTAGPGVVCENSSGGFCRLEEIVAGTENYFPWKPVILTSTVIGTGITIWRLTRPHRGTDRCPVVIPTDPCDPFKPKPNPPPTAETSEPASLSLLAIGLGTAIAEKHRRRRRLAFDGRAKSKQYGDFS